MLRRGTAYIKSISSAMNALCATGLRIRETITEEVMAKISKILLCVLLCISFFTGITNGEVIPYPGDCTKYQQCDGSGCFVLTCGIGTEFNPNIGTCDYPLQNRQDCMNRG